MTVEGQYRPNKTLVAIQSGNMLVSKFASSCSELGSRNRFSTACSAFAATASISSTLFTRFSPGNSLDLPCGKAAAAAAFPAVGPPAPSPAVDAGRGHGMAAAGLLANTTVEEQVRDRHRAVRSAAAHLYECRYLPSRATPRPRENCFQLGAGSARHLEASPPWTGLRRICLHIRRSDARWSSGALFAAGSKSQSPAFACTANQGGGGCSGSKRIDGAAPRRRSAARHRW
jgi:hypothetical protein